jgi:putative peptidoglycan lipid II flippase
LLDSPRIFIDIKIRGMTNRILRIIIFWHHLTMSFSKSFITVSFFTAISRLAGYVREIVIARYLGTSNLSDIFTIAFRLPNLFRSLFAEGAFNTAFIPMFAAKMSSEGKEEAIIFAERMLAILLAVLLGFTLVFELGMDYIMPVLAYGLSDRPEDLALATKLTRITFPYLLFISISALASGVLNSVGKFAAVAAAPIILNACIVTGAFIAAIFYDAPVYGMSIGVCVSGVVQFIWLYIALNRQDIKIRFVLPQKFPEMRDAWKRISSGIISSGVYQINLLIDTLIASSIVSTISYLRYGERIAQLPLSLIGTAMWTALLPLFSKQIKAGLLEESITTQNRAMELMLFLVLPASAALYVLAEPITAVLFQRGEFDAISSMNTAMVIKIFALGLPATVIIKILTVPFFARGDTKTPMKIAIFSLFANAIPNLIVINVFPSLGIPAHSGIAAVTSAVAWLSVAAYFVILVKRGHYHMDDIFKKRSLRTILAVAIMWVSLAVLMNLSVSYFGQWWNGDLERKRFLILGAVCAAGGGAYAIAAIVLRVFDVRELMKMVKLNR